MDMKAPLILKGLLFTPPPPFFWELKYPPVKTRVKPTTACIVNKGTIMSDKMLSKHM